MSQSLYDLYQKTIFNLVRTMVVKHSEVADAINMGLTEKYRGEYPISTVDLTTWKYYKNLAGEYHIEDEILLANSIIPGKMTIKIASDTGPVDVAFTKEFIASDSATANEYRYGTNFYNALIRRYPEHQDLIDGILNPIDLQTAINAENGDILYAGGYFREFVNGRAVFLSKTIAGRKPPNYIDDNETNLLPKIEQFIKSFLFRWHNNGYCVTNDLYMASVIGVLYGALPGYILNVRLANVHTPFAHSYHIREYLESNGYLTRNIEVLPKPQLLWLYQNLRHVRANAGKVETFERLVNNLLTPSQIPLAKFDVRHSLANQDNTDPLNLYPDILYTREAINMPAVGAVGDSRTTKMMLELETDLARENSRDVDWVEQNIEFDMTNVSKSNWHPTKILESAIVDLSDALPYRLAESLVNLWIYHAWKGNYIGAVYATNPLSGDRIQLTPKQALIVYMYCMNMRVNTVTVDPGDQSLTHTPMELLDCKLTYLPTLEARMIPRQSTIPTGSDNAGLLPFPALTDVIGACNTQLIQRQDSLGAIVAEEVYPGWLVDNEVLASIAEPNSIEPLLSTTDEFYAWAHSVHDNIMRRYNAYANEEDSVGRALLESASEMCYWTVQCQLGTTTTDLYSEWLDSNGIDFSGFQLSDYLKLADELAKNAMGIADAKNHYLRDLQDAVITIMRRLSSYSVQYLKNITDDSQIVTAWGAMRLGNYKLAMNDETSAEFAEITALDIRGQFLATDTFGLFGDRLPIEWRARLDAHLDYDPVITASTNGQGSDLLNLPVSRFTILDLEPEVVGLPVVTPQNILDGLKYPNDNI